MGALRKFVTSLLPKKKQMPRIPVREKFAHFRAIGAANDAFLRRLAVLQQRLNSCDFVGPDLVAVEAESLSAHVRSMVDSLIAMTGGRYETLSEHFEALRRTLSHQASVRKPAGQGPMIVWPSDPLALQPEIVGPKAARLAEVSLKAGLSVPPFFSISAHAYRFFMEACGIQDTVNRMSRSLGAGEPSSIRNFSEAIHRALYEASFPAALEGEFSAGYQKLVDSNPGITGVAVRSSAVVEDGGSSFAGQFESVLNVPKSQLARAYKEVIASKYRYDALKYALTRGHLDDIAMPVLVMAMVKPSVSGVAYSRCPHRPDTSMVTAVPGLAHAADSGRVIPDTFFVALEEPAQIEVLPGKWDYSLRCAEDGGLIECAEGSENLHAPSLREEAVRSVARAARVLESHYGFPQDIEWTIDDIGNLAIVQTRPLVLASSSLMTQSEIPAVEGCRILVRGMRAAGGVASGEVFHLSDLEAVESVPEGVILCVPITSPRLAEVMGSVRGIIAAAGSPTGHMATLAREFEIPCIVGVENVFFALPPGAQVTLDAYAGIVYEGEVDNELLLSKLDTESRIGPSNTEKDRRHRLLDQVAPLTLTEPDSPDFCPGNCRTLHDFTRFVHQKSMTEMFNIEELSPSERRAAHRLSWRAPMEMLLLDLGGGIEEGSEHKVPIERIRSTALSALLEGMTDPRLRWAGPVGFDLKGFMSVVVRSAMDDQRYGEPIYCICAKDYVHFSSRLAYHFATVDAICSPSVNENYARFLFFGGAAVAERREWRAHLLATVLGSNEFAIKQEGDRVEAILAKRDSEQIEDSLVMLGRLMVASRHLDMVIESRAAARELAQAFLSGDYAFERVRGIGT